MIFSIRQIQEKCREQNMPLCMAFLDLTKTFDLVSRDGLFKILPKIGCPSCPSTTCLSTEHVYVSQISEPNNGHPLARQKDQQRGTEHLPDELHSNHPCTPPLVMDRACHQNGGNPNPQTAVRTTNGVFTPEQDNDKTNVEPVHSYDAFHTVVAGPGVVLSLSCSGVKTP